MVFASLRSSLLFIYLVIETCSATVTRRYAEEELDAKYWYDIGEKTLKDRVEQESPRPAKNVIYFLGDGMGIPTVTAARIYDGQKKGHTGEENYLYFETFPYTGLTKTYNVDKQVPDSAATATAFLCGVKANFYTLGLTARVKLNNCQASLDQNNHVQSIMKWAQDAGKATGFLTTTRVTHATLAGLYAHSANRDWEADSDMQSADGECVDIARQLVEQAPGNNVKVIMGGGRKKFLPEDKSGERQDGKNLIDTWIINSEAKLHRWRVITNLTTLLDVKPSETDSVLGLFNDDHMNFEGYWLSQNISRNEPSLSQMTKLAIEILQKTPDGFFLFIEGGRIDHGHHVNRARLALEETVAFSDAIRTAVSMVDLKETLVVVTADHSHVMAMSGYPERGNDITGAMLADAVDPVPGLNYTTLMYANGPGYSFPPPDGTGINRTGEDTTSFEYRQLAAFPKQYETHGGEDVPVYAIGPMAHLFRGVYEQSYIPHAIGYAACYKGDFDQCRVSKQTTVRFTTESTDIETNRTSMAASLKVSHVLLFLTVCIMQLLT